MIHLPRSLEAWNTPGFQETLKDEIAHLDPVLLPLQEGLSQASYTSGNNISVLILNVSETAESIHVKTGIFYTGIIAGCSCADDPTPVSEITEYCEVQFDIDKQAGETKVTLLQ